MRRLLILLLVGAVLAVGWESWPTTEVGSSLDPQLGQSDPVIADLRQVRGTGLSSASRAQVLRRLAQALPTMRSTPRRAHRPPGR